MVQRQNARPSLRRQRKTSTSPLALLLVMIGVLLAFWTGLVPQRLSPFAPLNLAQAAPWFVDFRLAALNNNRTQCAAVLVPPVITAAPLADQPYKGGCGWLAAVRVTEAGGARIHTEALTCEVAAALALWLEHEVQLAAMAHFGQKVVSVQTLGTYACRNIQGNKLWKGFRSQHATANAIDVSGFTLADGTAIVVRKDWSGSSGRSAFLHEVHRGACRTFRVALGPDYNAAHHDHFHLDRGFIKSCK